MKEVTLIFLLRAGKLAMARLTHLLTRFILVREKINYVTLLSNLDRN